jgi:hypothetical protein
MDTESSQALAPPAPNMALQRTRALAFARVRSLPSVARRSPLNARSLGVTRVRA